MLNDLLRAEQARSDTHLCGSINLESHEDPPLVSIVVIGFNQQDFAPLAIKSVLDQTYTKLECIFVDDGSKDSTFERAAALAHTDTRLTVYKKENGGPSSARNHGAARISANARYIAFLDGDDMFDRKFVEVCLRHLCGNPSVGAVIPSYEYVDVSGAPLTTREPGYRWVPSSFWLWPRRLRDSEYVTPFVSFYSGYRVPFWLARAADYGKTDGWDETLWFIEDADMVCQLAMATTVHVVPQRLVRYRVHPQQATQGGAATSGRKLESISRVQEKWNKRHYPDPQKNRVLDLACIYYRVVHLPFRALWVGWRTLREVIRSPSLKSLSWFVRLMFYFVRDFFYFKVFFWRSTRRYVSTRFYEAT